MEFDNILSEINGFGKFQIKLVLIQILSRITIPLHFLLNNFIGAVPSHHCNISGLDDGGVFGNLTLEQKLAVGIPAEQHGPLSSCLMFSVPQYKYLSASNSSEDKAIVQCQNGWVYDNSTFKSTLATEVASRVSSVAHGKREDKVVIRTVVGVLGKAFAEGAFTIMYLFTTELYPTVVRQNGLGYTSFLARLGVSISPLIMLLEDVWPLLPALSYCAVAVGSGLVVLLLPETLNARLPELIEDIEKPL
ncbi:hypothetical protein PAMA_016432 [Pampus argenteus]